MAKATANLWKKKFDPEGDYVWRQAYPGVEMGSPVNKSDFHPRRVEQLYGTRKIVFADVWNEFMNGTAPKKASKPVSLPVSNAAPHENGKATDDGGDAPSTETKDTDPLDHDRDGKKGGAKPVEERDSLEPLREELRALGVEVDGRWGEKRLNEELEKATAPKSLPGV